MTIPDSLFLIGLMGAGKTTVGRALARATGKTFYDSDHEVEARTGVRIPLIFEIEGGDGFRARELCARRQIVLGTGGGAVLRPENRQQLRANGCVIYLRASPEELYQRTAHDKNRPLLQTADPLQRLRELYAVRDPIYSELADLVIDTSRQTVHSMMQLVLRELEHHAHRSS